MAITVSLRHPTDLPNFSIVTIGNVQLAFSYETIVGYSAGFRWIVSENRWSKTTGKHLSWLGRERVPREEFEAGLASLLSQIQEVKS